MYFSKYASINLLLLVGSVFLANVILVSTVSGNQDPDYPTDIYIPVPKSIQLSDSVFLDNNDNRWDTVKISGEISNQWNLAADLSYWKLDEPHLLAELPGSLAAEPLTGYRGMVKASIKATNRVIVIGELGFYDWLDQDAGWKGSLSSNVTIGQGNLTFRLYRDQLIELDPSYDALVEEIEYEALDVSLWTPLWNRSAYYGSVSAVNLSDDRISASTYMSLTTQPWSARRINVGVSLFVVGFDGYSEFYWSPELDGSLSFIADAVFSVMPSWDIKVGGSVGRTYSRDGARYNIDNNSYSLLLASEWKVNNYTIAFEVNEDRSLSDSPYETRHFLISLKRGF